VESSVSLSWCIRQGTRGEGDGDADYLPPNFNYHHEIFTRGQKLGQFENGCIAIHCSTWVD